MAPMLNTFVKVALPEFFKSQLAQASLSQSLSSIALSACVRACVRACYRLCIADDCALSMIGDARAFPQIPIKKLPKWLQKIIASAENKDAVSLFETLLSAIFYREEKFIQKSKSGAMEEMAALAEGYCASGIEGSQCDEKKFLRLIQNMYVHSRTVRVHGIEIQGHFMFERNVRIQRTLVGSVVLLQ